MAPLPEFQDRCLKPLGHPSVAATSTTWRAPDQDRLVNGVQPGPKRRSAPGNRAAGAPVGPRHDELFPLATKPCCAPDATVLKSLARKDCTNEALPKAHSGSSSNSGCVNGFTSESASVVCRGHDRRFKRFRAACARYCVAGPTGSGTCPGTIAAALPEAALDQRRSDLSDVDRAAGWRASDNDHASRQRIAAHPRRLRR